MLRRFKNSALAAMAMLAEKNNMVMVVPADASPDVSVPLVSTDDIRKQLNNLTTSFRALCAKLDVNHGAAADHVATITDAAVATAPVRIKNG